jgi:hypothetical protein
VWYLFVYCFIQFADCWEELHIRRGDLFNHQYADRCVQPAAISADRPSAHLRVIQSISAGRRATHRPALIGIAMLLGDKQLHYEEPIIRTE